MNGFLTDGCLIQFFRLAKIEAQLLWTEGPVYLHNGGDQWLLGLLQDTSVHEVPAVAIGREPVAMGELLVIGGSSVVYMPDRTLNFHPSFYALQPPNVHRGRNYRRSSGGEAIHFVTQAERP